MIVSNLDNILKRKRLSVNKVSIDTGISRQTLTSLANNESKGIQFSTLEVLMEYLEVGLTDILIDQSSKIRIGTKLLSNNDLNEIGLVGENKKNEDIYIIGFVIKHDDNNRYLYFNTEISINETNRIITINTSPIITKDEEDVTIRNLKAFERYFNKLTYDQFYELGSRNTQEIIHRKFPDITSKFSYTVNLTWNLFESKELYSVIVEGNNDNRLRFISSVFRTRVNQNQQNGMEEEIEVGAWRK